MKHNVHTGWMQSSRTILLWIMGTARGEDTGSAKLAMDAEGDAASREEIQVFILPKDYLLPPFRQHRSPNIAIHPRLKKKKSTPSNDRKRLCFSYLVVGHCATPFGKLQLPTSGHAMPLSTKTLLMKERLASGQLHLTELQFCFSGQATGRESVQSSKLSWCGSLPTAGFYLFSFRACFLRRRWWVGVEWRDYLQTVSLKCSLHFSVSLLFAWFLLIESLKSFILPFVLLLVMDDI